eukprot:superscaffoldBa00000653_g6337
MKCFSRYLPYLFRPPSTILSSTCHTEGRVGRRGAITGLLPRLHLLQLVQHRALLLLQALSWQVVAFVLPE